MDKYFPKTRRHRAVHSIKDAKISILKPPEEQITPKLTTKLSNAAKPTSTICTTPVKKSNASSTLQEPPSPASCTTNNNNNNDINQCTPPKAKIVANPKDRPRKRPLLEPPSAPRKRTKPAAFRKLFDDQSKISKLDLSPIEACSDSAKKINDGPLKGISTSLLEMVRAKEAASKLLTPQQERNRDLIGIAPELARIIPTVFTASKREVMPYDKIIDNCCKSLKMNYTSKTIDDCVSLMVDSITPDWISVVTITRGKFMRLNKDKYSIPQLLEAIKRYKRDNNF